ncbi:GNAT family N-acetyltransferase [Paenibacillus polysaccharolyticus]|uniref:GNAT family N-acetyltransferase n=1 Tax=Paenibacillus polysaccharolyticus TaxID=582692 RepID=UPI00203E131D|nr:GNAT family N-acetyltransferase [Paenibacillus polysaccharolyticus]MCM3134295.1 GNAT family N-acetyltransferase [Paenibacillus polysaccharolyticus]
MNHGFSIVANSVMLRPFNLQDQATLAALTQQPEITDLLPDWQMTEEQLSEFLQFVVGNYEQFDPQDVRVMLAVIHQESRELIGWCGVFPNDMLDPSDREIAYAISRDHRNKGYITEAVGALIAYLFEHTSLNGIVGIVKTNNQASRRVLEHTCFQYVNRRRLSDGEVYDYFELHSTNSDGEASSQIISKSLSINLRRAEHEDAVVLTAICTRAFDHAMHVWANGEKKLDSNLCPPGYNAVRLHEYVIREWDYYVVEADGCAIGGVSINVLGYGIARLDKIYIDPVCQGCGVGSQAIRQIETVFPHILRWRLETSGRQTSNHHFYEKLGYVRIYASDAEYGYEKKIDAEGRQHNREKEREHVQANLDSMWYSSSTMRNSRITDCDLSEAN